MYAARSEAHGMASVHRERQDRLVREAKKHGVRIALVSLYDVENNAVRILAAELRRKGHHVAEIFFKDWISNHLDPATPEELDALVEILQKEGIQLVGLSIRASAYYETARLLTRVVHERVGIPVLWGGMHSTVAPESATNDADLLLQGEGEPALGDLADRLRDGTDITDTPNTWTRLADDSFHKNALRPLVTDLDSLAWRDYVTHDHKYFIWKKEWKLGDPMHGDPVFQMMGSRGCVFKCSFCYNSTYKKDIYPGQKWYRVRSPESMVAEIQAARQHWDFKKIRFDDEVFFFQADWLEEFTTRYARDVGLPFEIFIEPKLVTEERMTKLRDAGLESVNMGVQATERVTGHLYDRRVKNQTVADVANLFHRLGIRGHFQLIFDDPATNADDYGKLFELVDSFPKGFDLYLFSMTVFPGSELNQKLVQSGVITPWEVEGANVRTFYQHRINLKYPRPVEDTFWISLISMLSKDFVPRPLLRAAAKSQFLKKHPWPLIQMSSATNFAKMGSIAAKMAVNGEMTPTLIRRWLSMERQITA
jgi:anaerobic magnesium-protoporphyrin IX monomethyl ester cyclase